MARISPNVGTRIDGGRCNPTNPGPENVSIQISVSAIGRRITISTIDTACKQSFARTYIVTAQDGDIFDLPDDLHPTTLEMLDGVARRFMQFAKHGFDREP